MARKEKEYREHDNFMTDNRRDNNDRDLAEPRSGKGTAHANKMMGHMQTYGGQESPGYHPPTGSAGSAAHGEYSTKHNPLRVPEKGSAIGAGYGNADRMKAMRNEKEQEVKENLRGYAC